MNEYLIKKETLAATADALKSHLTSKKFVINEDFIATGNRLLDDAVEIAYYEYIDYNVNYGPEGAHPEDIFWTFNYLENNEGIVVPVLYKEDSSIKDPESEYFGPDFFDPFYYIEDVIIDNNIYNKWRKIESGSDVFNWNTNAKQYVYTNKIVNTEIVSPSIEQIDPTDFPEKIHEVYEAGKAVNGGDILKQLINRTITEIDLTKFGDKDIIGAYAFSQCTNLETVILPSTEFTVGEYAFYNCINLKNAFYPGGQQDWETYVTIGDGNDNLINNILIYSEQDMSMDGGHRYWHYVDGIPTLWECKVSRGLAYSYRDADYTWEVTGIGECQDKDIAIPHTFNTVPVSRIAYRAFYETDITGINIPENINTLGVQSFYKCSNLKNVNISDGLKSIESDAFWGCSNVVSIVIPNTVTTIRSSAFRETGLIEITIPKTVITMGDSLFLNCTQLKSVKFLNNFDDLPQTTFYRCKALETIYLPEITSIGSSAIDLIGHSITIYYRGTENKWNEVVGYKPSYESYMIYGTEYRSGIIYEANEDWTEYEVIGYESRIYDSDTLYIYDDVNGIPVTQVRESCCQGPNHYIFIHIGENIKYIGAHAFEHNNFNTVNIPGNVEYVGDYAFANNSLSTINIQNGVQSLGSYVFDGCPDISSISIPISLVEVGYDTFNFGYEIEILYAGNYLDWLNIMWYGEPPTNINYFSNLPDHVAENGLLYTYYDDFSYQCASAENINTSHVIIADYINGLPVVSVGRYAFCHETVHNMVETIVIPNTVETIGVGAFALGSPDDGMGDPSYLTSTIKHIDIADGVSFISSYAFYYCTGLTSITIPDSIKSIGQFAFEECIRLTSIDIGAGVIAIGQYAFGPLGWFDPCTVIFKGTPNGIGEYAFSCYSGTGSVMYVPWSEGEIDNAPWGFEDEIVYNYTA